MDHGERAAVVCGRRLARKEERTSGACEGALRVAEDVVVLVPASAAAAIAVLVADAGVVLVLVVLEDTHKV